MSLLSIVFNIVRHFYSSRHFSSLIGRQKHPITLRLYYDFIYAFTLCIKNVSGFLYGRGGDRTHSHWKTAAADQTSALDHSAILTMRYPLYFPVLY